VAGVCKVGSYVGNGAADGPVVDLGFKASYILIKNSSESQDWRIYTTTISPINPAIDFFKANTNAAEIESNGFDFLANGLKARATDAGFNGSGSTMIYVAMADIGGNGTLPPIYGR